MELNNKTYVGTEMKYKVTISATGFNINNDDWNIEVFRGKTSRKFTKEECIHGLDGWYLCFDTTDFGPGLYYAILTAYVPDSDFPDGYRTEVKKLLLEPVESL